MPPTDTPAYPTAPQMTPGMTLRDYFAAQTLPHTRGTCTWTTAAQMAENAYRIADAMLVERSK